MVVTAIFVAGAVTLGDIGVHGGNGSRGSSVGNVSVFKSIIKFAEYQALADELHIDHTDE